MQAHLGTNHPQQRYSTNFIEWDDTPSYVDALQRASTPTASSTRVGALRHLLRDPVTLADAMGLRLSASEHADRAFAQVGTGTHYRDTVPSALLPLMPSTPFREPLNGMAVREVTDADFFRHFFGR